jgi:Domain of unknown function (DUF5666)
MRFRVFSAMYAFLLGTAGFAVISPGTLAGDRISVTAIPDAKTVSGTISSIGDASFTVDVKRGQNIESMQFLIDDATRFDGKLVTGAQATVQFRTADGNNIAIHVSVRPGSTHGLP